jgi:hypothetical protein
VPVQGEGFDLTFRGHDALDVAGSSIGHGIGDHLPHRVFPGGQQGRPCYRWRGEGDTRSLFLSALRGGSGFGRDRYLARTGDREVDTFVVILWPCDASMGRDPLPLQHTVGRITRHLGGNGDRHVAGDVFALPPGTAMLGARAVHYFPDLDPLRGVHGIQQEHSARSDVVGPVAEEEPERQGAGVDLDEPFADRHIEARMPREPWWCACNWPTSDVTLQIIRRAWPGLRHEPVSFSGPGHNPKHEEAGHEHQP